MDKKRILLLTLCFSFALVETVYANSSWCWVSAKRLWDILPVVVLAANLLSFAMPYAVYYLSGRQVYTSMLQTLNLRNHGKEEKTQTA